MLALLHQRGLLQELQVHAVDETRRDKLLLRPATIPDLTLEERPTLTLGLKPNPTSLQAPHTSGLVQLYHATL